MPTSFEEYLALEEKAQSRSEFYNGEILPMPSENRHHSLIISNLIRQLGNALDRSDNELHAGRLLFRTGSLGAYPDLMILCGQPKFEDERERVALNPKVLIEVLSPATEVHDRGTKAYEYWQCPSIQQYFLISQDEPLVNIQTRHASGKLTAEWITGREALCPFESLGTTLPMTDIYERITF